MEGTLVENLQSLPNQQCTHSGQDLGKPTHPPKARAQSEKGSVKWESQDQKPQLHPAQLLQATGVTTYHLDSEMVQAHLLSCSFGIIRSVTAWSAVRIRLLEALPALQVGAFFASRLGHHNLQGNITTVKGE